MTIFFIILVLLIFFILYTVKIEYLIKLVNFDFTVKVIIKTPLSKEIFNNKKKKQKEGQASGANKKAKVDLATLKQLKKPVSNALTEVCKILKKQCKLIKVDIWSKVALADPMENGIAFGMTSGGLNIIGVLLKETCNVKDLNVNVVSDFDSEEGFIFESGGTLNIKPVLLLISVVSNRKLIKNIKNIFAILKREEDFNG